MDVSYATEPGTPGRRNEDYVVCGPDWAVVLDGATAPDGVDSGCVHDVRWLVTRLAAAIAERMPLREAPLDDLLSEAISDVRRTHDRTCDLENPDSPSTTASLCRVTGTTLEYLVLADSPVVLWDPAQGARVFCDEMLSQLASRRVYSPAMTRATRNRPGGFWVASTDTTAPYHAVRGSAELAPGCELAMLTDGASRPVELYGHTWESLFETLRNAGPRGLIARVRALEAASPPPHGKAHDDATAVHATSLT